MKIEELELERDEYKQNFDQTKEQLDKEQEEYSLAVKVLRGQYGNETRSSN
jgi:hypothetical protein